MLLLRALNLEPGKSVMARVEAHAREDTDIWLTDDRRRLPVQIRVRMQLAIGTITFQLRKHEGS
jgi:hypothetical protein